MPAQVVAISGCRPPWFHANVLVGGVVGTVMHAIALQSGGGCVAKKNQSGCANIVSVGVRCGSAVTMWSAFIPTGSATATVRSSGWPVYGLTRLSFASVRPNVARGRIGPARVARDVDRRRHVRVNRERCRNAVLRAISPARLRVDLADAGCTWHGTFTPSQPAGVGCAPAKWSPSSTVNDEERVALVDAVRCQAVEELAEGLVVVLQLLDIVGLARAPGRVDLARDAVLVVRVRDVAERHRDPGLLHLRDVGERRAGKQPVEAGEAAAGRTGR